MRVICYPSKLEGQFLAIPSKSDAHRVLICSALANDETLIKMSTDISEDIKATINCLSALGAEIIKKDNGFLVKPIKSCPNEPVLDCGESGSTFRFLLPVAAALGSNASFKGSARLPQRPIKPLIDALKSGGIGFDSDVLPFKISGKLKSSTYVLPGDISSQFISGLLMALPKVSGGGKINLTNEAESKGYIDMTIESLLQFGIKIKTEGLVYGVNESSFNSPKEIEIEGDWSNSAFFLSAAAIDGDVSGMGLKGKTFQGDSKILELLSAFGANVRENENEFNIKSDSLKGISIDAREIPDLVPILAVVAAFAEGKTEIYNAKRLRIKESDRLKTVAEMLKNLGANVSEAEDSLTIFGGTSLKGGVIDCCKDHRIAMSAAIAALFCEGETVLEGADAVYKSYPRFFEEYKLLGGKCDVIYDG